MRPERPSTTTVLTLLGSLLLLVAAIGGPATATPAASTAAQSSDYAQTDAPDGDNRTAETILDTYEQRLSSAETLSMTVVSNSSSESTASSVRQSIWVDYEENQMRAESNTSYGETITVRNESGTVVYNVEDNTVNRYNYTFNEQYSTPLSLTTITNDSDVTYAGTETVDGTETYRLDIEPETQYGDYSYEVSVWIDTETYLPVQSQTSSESGSYSYESTQDYRNVTVNETIPDDRFTIDIPEDAEQPDYSTPDFYSYDSESELRANTSQSVPDPDVPANYSFESGYVTDGEEYNSVTLSYTTDDDDSLTVSKRDTASYNYSQSDNYDEVSVGNATGYYNEFDYGESNISILVWESGDHRYTIYGSLSESETIDIAESIDGE